MDSGEFYLFQQGEKMSTLGIIAIDLGREESPEKVILQPDGKILAVGSTDNSSNSYNSFVIRLNADGSLDPTFSGSGKLIMDIGGGASDWIGDVTLQPDGKIVLAGQSSTGSNFLDYRHFSVIRLNNDGSLDTTFSGDGKAIVDVGGEGVSEHSRCILQPDGKIVVVAPTDSLDYCLIRLNADGSLDKSFSGDGKAIVDLGGSDFPRGIALQPDGKIVVAGYSWLIPGTSSFSVSSLRES
jgi:uncharacterized delta-60 repeat protein